MVGRNLKTHPLAKKWRVIAPAHSEIDLTDFTAISKYIQKLAPDIIIHAAGKVGGIAVNIEEPLSFLDQNLMMGRNVIYAAHQAGVKKLLNLASTCVYPRNAPNPLREDQILNGEFEPTNEGYALAKIISLKMCLYIRKQNPDFVYKTLIPCNLYGCYDTFCAQKSHLLPAIIHKIHQAKSSKAETIEIWGDGTARREFMYAADLAEMIFLALENLNNIPDLMNVGSGTDYSVNEFCQIVRDIIGWKGTFEHNLSKPVGMQKKLCDNHLLSTWGWQPKTSLHQGILQTYQYYLETLST